MINPWGLDFENFKALGGEVHWEHSKDVMGVTGDNALTFVAPIMRGGAS